MAEVEFVAAMIAVAVSRCHISCLCFICGYCHVWRCVIC